MEPPYEEILEELQQGMVIPFLGAGASMIAPPGAKWDPKNPAFLPSGWDLSELLASRANFPTSDVKERQNLAKVASYFSEIIGRPKLRSRLKEILDRKFPHGSLHDFLASIPTPMIVITTNYDVLMEQAFRQQGKPYDLIIYPTDNMEMKNGFLWWPHGADAPKEVDSNGFDIDLKTRSVIYKMHGTIVPEVEEYNHFVISEDDYVNFLARLTQRTAVPSFIYPYLEDRRFLFLGYSLNDWNIKVILRRIHNDIPKTIKTNPHYAIQYPVKEVDEILWRSRNVHIFNSKVDDFVEKIIKHQEEE